MEYGCSQITRVNRLSCVHPTDLWSVVVTFTTLMDPLGGPLFPIHVHRLSLGRVIDGVAERVRDAARQFDLVLDRGMQPRRVEGRGGEQFPYTVKWCMRRRRSRRAAAVYFVMDGQRQQQRRRHGGQGIEKNTR